MNAYIKSTCLLLNHINIFVVSNIHVIVIVILLFLLHFLLLLLPLYPPPPAPALKHYLLIAGNNFIVKPQSLSLYREFWKTVIDDTQIVFRIKAKSDAYIILATVPRNTKVLNYEVKIGKDSNTKTEIVKKDVRPLYYHNMP